MKLKRTNQDSVSVLETLTPVHPMLDLKHRTGCGALCFGQLRQCNAPAGSTAWMHATCARKRTNNNASPDTVSQNGSQISMPNIFFVPISFHQLG